jgi:hypothetical protein
MTFVAPWVLVALVLVVPAVVAFLMRRRRSVIKVPSTLLWQAVALRRIRNRKIRYLTRILALLACALAVVVLVGAAARPRREQQGETVAVVVDVSASMGRGEPGSPLAQARRHLGRMLWSRRPEDTYVIIAAGAEPRRLAGPTTEGALLDEALDAIEPGRGAADLGAAVDLGASLVRGASRARVLVLHDGGDGAGDMPDMPVGNPPPALQERRFRWGGGGSGDVRPDNLGIVTFATRRPADIEDEDEREVLVVAATSSPVGRRAKVTVEAFGVVLAEQRVDVPPAGEAEVRLRIRTPAREVLARVTALDGRPELLSADDEVRLVQGVVVPPRVFLVAASDAPEAETFFAEQALRAAGVRQIERVTPADAHLRVGSRDVVVALTAPPDTRPTAPVLYLGTRARAGGSGLPVRGQRELTVDAEGDPTRLRSVASHHALMRGVDLEGVAIQRALAADVPEGARALVELDGGAVVLAGGDGTDGWVYVGIDPLRSDLVLRVAFPVLVANALALLGGATQVSVAETVPRSEVTLLPGAGLGAVEAPEEALRLPRAPSVWLALAGALLLGAELFTWRKGWTR